jgi:iron complex outermembrane receptor protein
MNFKNAKKIILILIAIFCLSPESFSQVKGIVIDISNRSPLPFAIIKYGENKVTLSNEEGRFEIPDATFPLVLQISFLGYEQIEKEFEQPTDNLTVELNPSEFMLGEVIVSAYQLNQSIIEVPGSIALISQKEFTVDNDVNIVPSLNRVPGIYMHSGTYNTNRLTIRGIGSRSLFSTTKIRAYFKEIPLTTGDGETTIEDIDPDLLQRVEIIKGPSSSLYGAGLGGTLLMTPKSPKNGEKGVTYRMSAGSYGYIKNSLMLDYGSDKNRLALSINNIHSDGYRENNQFDRFSSGLSFQSYISPKTTLGIIGNFIKLKAFIPSSIDIDTYQNSPSSAAANWEEAKGYEDYFKIQSGVSINHHISKRSMIDASVFTSARNAYELRPFNILKENTLAFGGRLRYAYSKNWNDYRLNITTGMEAFKDVYNWQTIENDNREEGNLLSDNQEDRINLNVFMKSDFQFPSGTEISLGFNINRTDYKYTDQYSIDSIDDSRSSNFGIVLSPRFAISQPLLPNVNLYGTVSHGFSPPTLPETLTPEGTINPDIQPARGINYEVGMKGLVVNKRFYFDFALFTMDIKDLLVAERIGEDEFIGVNAGRTRHNGIELTLNYEILDINKFENRITSFITYTLADYTFREFINEDNDYSGNSLTGVPQNVINAGLSIKLKKGLYSNLNYQFVDKMPMRDDNSIYSDSYQLINLRIGYKRILSKHFSLDIYGLLNNLTNTKYASMISVNAASFGGRPPRYYYPGLPRNAYGGLSVSYSFN